MSAETKDAVLAALAPRTEEITIGATVLSVRELESAADTVGLAGDTDTAYKLLVRCVFGADGAAFFSDADIPRLKNSSMKGLKPLLDSVLRVNGFDKDDNVKKSDPQS